MKEEELIKGKGAQKNSHNPFNTQHYVTEHIEGIDEEWDLQQKVKLVEETPQKIVNKVDSPDLGLMYSMNPYQGCEHGCIYCYARNSHQYWGYSAGLDFEQNIIVKKNAPELLRRHFRNKNWGPAPIMLSGNTDCYQPSEKKLEITRRILEVFLEFRNPVSIITKNSLILRDVDLLQELAALNLVHVSVSITSLSEETRRMLEPRTASGKKRLDVVEKLSAVGIPVNVMVAPIIPAINSHEIPAIIEEAARRGAVSAGYTMVRLNGSVAEIFKDWIYKAYPDRAEKVLAQIASCHGGKLNDSRFGTRMKGEGNIAASITQVFRLSKARFMNGRSLPEYDLTLFKRPGKDQLSLF